MIQSNIDKLGLLPCRKCGLWEEHIDECVCSDHWIEECPERYTHFRIKGQWYVPRQRFIRPLLTLIEVEDAMAICGRLDDPEPERIENLTDIFALARKNGCTEEQLKKVYPPDQVERMRGRTLKRLVKNR